MKEGVERMNEDHPRARPAHHLLDLISHLGLVAVDFAEGAEFLMDLERTSLESEQGIVRELLTSGADFLSPCMMLGVTIFPDHHGNQFLFLLPFLELLGDSLRFGAVHVDLPFSFSHIQSFYLFLNEEKTTLKSVSKKPKRNSQI